MRISFYWKAWLFILPCYEAFIAPKQVKRLVSKLFMDTPAITDLLQEYSREIQTVSKTGKTMSKTSAPIEIDFVPPLTSNSPTIDSVKSIDISPQLNVDVSPPIPNAHIPIEAIDTKVLTGDSASEKVPILIDWMKENAKEVEDKLRSANPSLVSSPIDPTSFDQVSNLKEKLTIIQHNILGLASGITSVPSNDKHFSIESDRLESIVGKLVTAATALASTFAATTFDLSKYLEKLQLEAYGAWYAVGITFIWGMLQRKAGKDEVEEVFREELQKAREKAEEAATYATIAEKSASAVKTMFYMADNDANRQVLQESKTRVLELDMDIIRKEADRLKAESITLKSYLKKAESEAAKVAILEAKLAAAEARLNLSKEVDIPKAATTKQVKRVTIKSSEEDISSSNVEVTLTPSESSESEMESREALVEIVDIQNKKSTSGKSKSSLSNSSKSGGVKRVKKGAGKRRVPEDSESVNLSLNTEDIVTEKLIETVENTESDFSNSEINNSGIQESVEAEISPTEILNAEQLVANLSEDSLATNIVASPTSDPKANMEVGSPIDASNGESPPEKTTKGVKSVKTRKKVLTKASKSIAESSEKPTSATVNLDSSWASLSEAALKRKTVKELCEFLISQGVSTEDGDGNALKKAQLIDAVQRLA